MRLTVFSSRSFLRFLVFFMLIFVLVSSLGCGKRGEPYRPSELAGEIADEIAGEIAGELAGEIAGKISGQTES